MKRPLGVILSCIVLGLLALSQFLAAAMVFGAFAMRHPVGATATHPAMPPPPSFVFGVLFGFAFLLLVFVVWTISTLVGVAMLRNWARYSVLVIGGCLAAFGILALLVTAIAAATTIGTLGMPRSASGSTLPPHTMQIVFAFYAFLWAIVVAIGVWWLIYFNQSKTKAYFLPLYAADPAFYPPTYPGATPPPLPYASPARANRAPTPIIVLACFYLIASLCCLLYCFLPFPVFVFGLLIHGHGAPFIYFLMSVLTGLIGWGLIRLDNRARIAAFVSLVMGFVSTIVLMLPWGRSQLQLYSAELNARMGITQPTQTFLYSGPVMIVSGIFGLAIYGGIAWLLHRYRYPFTGGTPPPPDPLKTPLVL